MLDIMGESLVLPSSTRTVETMEMRVQKEARREMLVRRRVAEDSAGMDVGWGICGGGKTIWGEDDLGGMDRHDIYSGGSEHHAAGYMAAVLPSTGNYFLFQSGT